MLIALGVLCALVLLLCIPLSVLVRWEGEPWAELRWLFVRVALYPRPPKPEKPQKKRKKRAKSEENAQETPKKRMELEQLVELAGNIVQSADAPLRMVLHNLRVRDFVLQVTVAAEDAAEAAIAYGRMQAYLHTALGFLQNYIRMVNPVLDIRPDFLGEKNAWSLRLRAVVTPLVLLAAGTRAACAFLWNSVKRGVSAPPQA